jgi:predicted acyl esterase
LILPKIKIPTLSIAGFKDFWVSGLDRLNSKLADRSDFSMLIGPWVHEFPEKATVPIKQGVYLAWFDRHLLGDANAPQFPKASMLGVQDAATKTWHQYDAWPPKDATLTRFYLAANGGLSQEPVAAATSSYAVAADGSSGEVSFATSPFQSPRTLVGQVKVTVPVTLTATDGNLIAEIFDRAPDGTLVSIGYAGYVRVSHRNSDVSPEPVQPNVTYQVTLTTPSHHWAFGAGHRMELVIKSADKIVGGSAPAGTVAITGGPQSAVEARFR